MVSLVDREKWAPQIGMLMIAFGSIEGVTLDALKIWTNAALYKHMRKASLSSRIDLLLDLVELQDHTKENKRFFAQSLLKIKPITQYRNLVAHNGPGLLIAIDQDNLPVREAITSNIDHAKFIEFDELARIAGEVEAISESLYEAMARFRLESLDIDSLAGFGAFRYTQLSSA